MSSFTDLLRLPEPELVGALHTAREIAQQPRLWEKVLDLLDERAGDMARFLRRAGVSESGDCTVLLCGAGSSDYVGTSIAPGLRQRLRREVIPVATTRIVTNPGSIFIPGRSYTVVHVSRSGDSPESIAAYRLLKSQRPDASHMVISCNADGALAREAAPDPNAFVLLLPPEANDRSLAMTSSFTGMALCGIGMGWLARLGALRDAMDPVRRGAERLLSEHAELISSFARMGFSKACYLGSHALEGAMQEGALKMLEMTAGAVSTVSNSFLGIRHGPRVFIDGGCAIIACLSSSARTRRYELDLLRDLRDRRQGAGILAVSAVDDPMARRLSDRLVVLARPGEELLDELRVLTDVVACQMLAFFASRARGVAPDSPSPSGVISRVVQGVTIYE